jgi:hypothetical protein
MITCIQIRGGKRYQADNDVVDSTDSIPFDHCGAQGPSYVRRPAPNLLWLLRNRSHVPGMSYEKGTGIVIVCTSYDNVCITTRSTSTEGVGGG